MADYTATDATLNAVAKTCQPGDRITVTGDWLLTRLNGIRLAAPGIVIEGGRFTGWILSDAKGITIRNAAMIPVPSGAAFGVGGPLCERIVFEDCEMGGLGAVSGGGQAGISKGGVSWIRCRFHDLGQGLNMQGGLGHVVEDCTFRDIWSDAITGNPAGDIRITGNHFTNYRGPSLHLDCIQIFTRSGQLPVENVVIENNAYERGEGTPSQFILLANEGQIAGGGFRNMTVRGNAMFGGSYHGISITGTQAGPSCANAVIEDNFIQPTLEPYLAPGSTTPTTINQAWIRVMWCDTTVQLRNNRACTVELYPNIDGGGNVNIPAAVNRNDRALYDAWLHRNDPPPAPPPPPELTDAEKLAALQAQHDAYVIAEDAEDVVQASELAESQAATAAANSLARSLEAALGVLSLDYEAQAAELSEANSLAGSLQAQLDAAALDYSAMTAERDVLAGKVAGALAVLQ